MKRNRKRYYKIKMMSRFFKEIKPCGENYTTRHYSERLEDLEHIQRYQADTWNYQKKWIHPFLSIAKPFVIEEVDDYTREPTILSKIVKLIKVTPPVKFTDLDDEDKKRMEIAYGPINPSRRIHPGSYFYKIYFTMYDEEE